MQELLTWMLSLAIIIISGTFRFSNVFELLNFTGVVVLTWFWDQRFTNTSSGWGYAPLVAPGSRRRHFLWKLGVSVKLELWSTVWQQQQWYTRVPAPEVDIKCQRDAKVYLKVMAVLDKNQMITAVVWISRMGTMSVCTDFMARLLNSSRYSRLESKWRVTNIQTDRAK